MCNTVLLNQDDILAYVTKNPEKLETLAEMERLLMWTRTRIAHTLVWDNYTDRVVDELLDRLCHDGPDLQCLCIR